MTHRICLGIVKSGERCKARALPDSAYCVSHSPDISDAERQAWRAKGGRNSSAQARARKVLPAQLMSVDEIESYLSLVYRGVIAGKIDPNVGNAASNIARTLAELKKAALEARLEELEAALGITKIRRTS
jgi:hypothetical protein